MEFLQEQEQFRELASELEKIVKHVDQGPWLSYPISGQAKTDLTASCKSLHTSVGQLYKQFVSYHVKLSKRKGLPGGVLDFPMSQREALKSLMSFFNAMQDKTRDADTLHDQMAIVAAGDLPVPTVFHLALHNTRLQEAMRCGNPEAIKSQMKQVHNGQSMHDANKEALESVS